MVEVFAWETESGLALHILNYNNPNLHRGYIRKHYPIGPQKVKLTLPEGKRVSRIQLLRDEQEIPFEVQDGSIEFTVPRVVDYEVAALHTS